MFWKKRAKPRRRNSVLTKSFQPRVEALEDRVMMHGATEAPGPSVIGSYQLGQLFNDYQAVNQQPNANFYASRSDMFRFTDDSVLVNVRSNSSNLSAMRTALAGLGMQGMLTPPGQWLVTGYLPINSIDDLPNVPNFAGSSQVIPAYTFVGAVDAQADALIGADIFRNTPPGFNGTGIQVGVISDSVNADVNGDGIGDGIPASRSTGDLPSATADIDILFDVNAADEGRAMMEIIHDIAPGADFSFFSALAGSVITSQGIYDLVNNGADVIVDDIGFFDSPWFNDGYMARAIDDVVANQGVVYVSAAGNAGNDAYESSWRAGGGGIGRTAGGQNEIVGTFFDFDPGTGLDRLQDFTLPVGGSFRLFLQWDSAFLDGGGSQLPQYQVKNDLDIYITDPTGQTIFARANTNSLPTQNGTNLAVEAISFSNFGQFATSEFAIAIQLRTGPMPTRIKWIQVGTDIQAQGEGAPTIFGHQSARNNLTIGAVPYHDVDTPEDFTALGPVTILFDSNGTRLSVPEIRQKPDFAAPDGSNTTFFGQDDDIDSDLDPNFYGTSAAAPAFAAGVALILSQNPNITRFQLINQLKNTAFDAGAPGYDFRTGFGVIQVTQSPLVPPQPARPPGDQNTVEGNTTDNGRFVTGIYQDILGRFPTNVEFAAMNRPLDTARQAFLTSTVTSLVTSPEARLKVIYDEAFFTGLYPRFLRRAPDDLFNDGLQLNEALARLNSGQSPEQIIAALVLGDPELTYSSPGFNEYYQLVGGTESAFMQQFYIDLFGQPMDAAARAAFSGALAGPRINLALSIMTAPVTSTSPPSYRQNLIHKYFNTILFRDATPAEVTSRLTAFRNRQTDEQIQAGILGLAEVMTTNGLANNIEWLDYAYNYIFGGGLQPDQAPFISQLNRGVSRTSVATQLFATAEYRTNLVNSLYFFFLGRSPEADELTAGVNGLATTTQEALISKLVGSAEYFDAHVTFGESLAVQNEEFVNALFDAPNFLGNGLNAYTGFFGTPLAPNGTEDESLTNAAPASQRTFVNNLLNSSQYETHVVTTIYVNLLGRNPTAAEVRAGIALVGAAGTPTNGDEKLFINVVSSMEYFVRQPGVDGFSTNASWVASIYPLVVQRGADQAEIDLAVTRIVNGYQLQRRNAVNSLVNGVEYRRQLITNTFQQYLLRNPTSTEMSANLTLLSRGTKIEAIAAKLAGSPEYFNNAVKGNRNNVSFVQSVYQDVLGRLPTQTEQDAAVNQIVRGQTKEAFALSLLNSVEYRTNLIDGYFNTFFAGNPPLAPELSLSALLGQMQRGASDQVIITILLQSRAYFELPHAFP